MKDFFVGGGKNMSYVIGLEGSRGVLRLLLVASRGPKSWILLMMVWAYTIASAHRRYYVLELVS